MQNKDEKKPGQIRDRKPEPGGQSRRSRDRYGEKPSNVVAGRNAVAELIKSGAPVDSYVDPVPGGMPGYDDPVIMAAGAFVQGASIELSCDGPMAPPYRAYLQGGLTFESGRLGIMRAADLLLTE